jgi:hypothetical protein
LSTELSFGQIEAVCAALNRIASDKRVAFMGRLKQLQKHDIIDPKRRPGRGKPGTYTFCDLMRFVVAVELMQCGLMPQMAARLVTGSWGAIESTIHSATYTDEELEEWQEMPFGPTTVDWYWMLTPEALRELTEEGFGKYDHMEAIMPVPAADVAERLSSDREIGMFGEGWRTIVLHGTKIAKATIEVVEFQYRYATAEDLRNEIEAEFARFKSVLEDAPFYGVEETARKHYDTTVEAVLHRLQDETLRARYHPSEAVLERQAKRIVGQLPPHQLAYIRAEDFDGQDIPELRAMNDLMGRGLLAPDTEADSIKLKLTPLGRTVQRLSTDEHIPADAIDDWRRLCRAKVEESVRRKIDSLLARDPGNPRDYDALEHWARHGGKAPLSEERKKEVSRKFVRGVLDEIGDDPEMKQEFVNALGRAAAREEANGDDQEA